MIKKWVDFVKIKFHLNENIEWICKMQLELDAINWIWIQFLELNSNTLNGIRIPELNWRPHIDVLLL